MTITINSETLCDLCGGKFTYEAMNAICAYFEECAPECAPRIGDICVGFSEIPADWANECDPESIIAHLDNGNIVVAQ